MIIPFSNLLPRVPLKEFRKVLNMKRRVWILAYFTGPPGAV